MKALIKTPDGVKCIQRAEPALSRPDDVKIKILSTAICRTDLYAAYGSILVEDGRILGHEFTGIVDEVGRSVTTTSPGRRVVINPLLSCGKCDTCESRMPHLCATTRFVGIDLDGAFAQWVVVPAAQVHELPDSISFTVGAYAEPLAAVMAMLDADLPINGDIAVTGSGRIADLTECVLIDYGYRAIRVDVTNPECSDYACVVETDLIPNNVEATLRLLKPGGILVMKSRRPEELSIPPLLCIKRRLRIQAVHYAPFELALEYLGKSNDKLQKFIGLTYPLEDYEQAFAAASADERLKIYFNPNG